MLTRTSDLDCNVILYTSPINRKCKQSFTIAWFEVHLYFQIKVLSANTTLTKTLLMNLLETKVNVFKFKMHGVH